MKALSIKQPWASLIAQGIKDIENRTWKTNFRGRVYIHASGQYSKGMLSLLNKQQVEDIRVNTDISFDFLRSAIIGEVDIVDCVINHHSVWAEQNEIYRCEESGLKILRPGQKYVYNWVLANAVLYDKPILNVKGALSFWNFEKPYEVVGTAEMVTL